MLLSSHVDFDLLSSDFATRTVAGSVKTFAQGQLTRGVAQSDFENSEFCCWPFVPDRRSSVLQQRISERKCTHERCAGRDQFGISPPGLPTKYRWVSRFGFARKLRAPISVDSMAGWQMLTMSRPPRCALSSQNQVGVGRPRTKSDPRVAPAR
jgi:hypothetical protein